MVSPFGMAFRDGYLYVANTDAVVRYKYTPGDLKAQGEPEKLLDLPGGGNHFTRNIVFSADGREDVRRCGFGGQHQRNGRQ
jgi:glucose/arabinose dehydrogenase